MQRKNFQREIPPTEFEKSEVVKRICVIYIFT